MPLCPCCKFARFGFARLPFAGTPAYAHGVISASAWRFLHKDLYDIFIFA
jgi:hypothetical protein